MERTLAPPERRVARVSGIDRLGAYHLIGAEDATGPEPRPGQFYMLGARLGRREGERPYLPRAFFARAACARRRLDFLLEAMGPGTGLPRARPGEGPALVGPLGIGFRPLAGGAGSACSSAAGSASRRCSAGEELAARRAPASCSASAPRPTPRPRALFRASPRGDRRRLGGPPGTRHGAAAERARRDPAAHVFAGPPPMLEAVRAICAERDTPAQLAMEAGMACGFGACFGCVVRLATATGACAWTARWSTPPARDAPSRGGWD